jgi:hypothetical protein
VAATARGLDEQQLALAGALTAAAVTSGELAGIVQRVGKGLRTGGSPSDYSREVEQTGELAIRLQRALNPESDYTPLSKAWRIALPLLFLVGLALAGALGSWLILRAIDRRAYLRRMVKRGIY